MPIIFVKLLIFVSFVFFCIFAFLPKRYLSLYYISRLTIPAFVFSYIWFVFFLFSYRLHTSYFPIVSTEWIRIVPDQPFLRVRIWTSYCKCSKGLPPAELDIDLPSPLMKIPSLFVLPQCPLTPHPLHPIYFFQFSPTRQATLLVGSPTHFKFQNAHFQKRLRRRKMCTTPSFCLSFSLFE